MNLIWTNDILSYSDDMDDEYSMEAEYEMMEEDFYEAQKKLDKPLNRPIVCIATVARWDGSHTAFQWVGDNLADVLDFARKNGETVKVFTDNGDLMAISTGHDNPVTPTTMWFRVLNEATEEREFEDIFCENWSSGFDCTEPLGKYWYEAN